MKKEILITGSITGFIRNALFKYLSPKNRVGRDKLYSIGRECFTPDRLFEFLLHVRSDIIIHTIGGRDDIAQRMFESNFLTTKLLFETVSKISNYKPRIIITGSAAEYGDSALNVGEDRVCKPMTDYGIIKHLQTELGLYYARKGMDIVIARIFNITGPGVSIESAIGSFAYQIAMNELPDGGKIIKTGNLSGNRDFVDIRDICSALWILAKEGKSGGIYNISSGEDAHIRAVLDNMIRLSNQNMFIYEDIKKDSGSFSFAGLNDKIKSIGWKQKYMLGESLKDTLNYYRREVRRESESKKK